MQRYIFAIYNDGTHEHVENIAIVESTYTKAARQAITYAETRKQDCSVSFTGTVEPIEDEN